MATGDIQYKTLRQLVEIQLDYLTANTPVPLTSPLGPFITAIAYATAMVALVLQRLIQLVLKAARLSTATGDDVDSFVADFGRVRSPAEKAIGDITFLKNVTAPTTILIPLGALVRTSTIPFVTFEVIEDTSKTAYSSILNAYQLLAGQTTVEVAVRCLEAGAVGNVLAGSINKIASSLAGVDQVFNPAAFTSGRDAMSDDEVRQDFVIYIQSLSKATAAAISFAVNSASFGLFHKIIEPNPPTGVVTVYVDDGSGSIGGALVSEVTGAINAVRPIGVRVDVLQATLHNGGYCVVASVIYDASLVSDLDALKAVIRSSITTELNGKGQPGDIFFFPRLYRAIFEASSPGNIVQTEVALYPPSTNNKINVLSTTDMSVGQLLEIKGLTTLTGELPSITRFGGANAPNEIEIDPHLTSAPAAGTVIQAFSTRAEQIINVSAIFLTPVRGNTTQKAGSNTTTRIYVNSLTSIQTGDYVIITDEIDPADIQHYQGNNNSTPVKVQALGADYIDLTAAIGLVAPNGVWAATIPPVGSKVITCDDTGTNDLTPPVSAVVRTKSQGSNQILVHLIAG